MGIKTPPTLKEGQILVHFAGIGYVPETEEFINDPPLDGFYILDRTGPREWLKYATGPLGEYTQVRFYYHTQPGYSWWALSGWVWGKDKQFEAPFRQHCFLYMGDFLLPMWFKNQLPIEDISKYYYGGIGTITALSPMEL